MIKQVADNRKTSMKKPTMIAKLLYLPQPFIGINSRAEMER